MVGADRAAWVALRLTASVMNRPPLEVADIVHQYGGAFLARDSATLSRAQHRALRASAVGRTAARGGHQAQCAPCGPEARSDNACRHRHCPKCHGAAQAAWLAAREPEGLDAPASMWCLRCRTPSAP
jgi:hypothetical protein